MFQINTLYKYPFLNATRDFAGQQDIAPLDALRSRVQILDAIRVMIADALDNKGTSAALAKDGDDAIYLYPWIRIILAFMKIPRVTYKVANLLSKYFIKQLATENEQSLLSIARDQGITVTRVADDQAFCIANIPFPFHVPVLDYIKISSTFKSPAWKLVNRFLQGGIVSLRKHDIIRMIGELVKIKVMERSSAANDEGLKTEFMAEPTFKAFFDDITERIQEKIATTGIVGENLPIDDGAYPPCINAIIERAKAGINLANSERLCLTSFLLTIGKPSDEVLDLFKAQPDFNEKTSRYQIQFAVTKKYMPHGCMTLESIDLCKKSDARLGNKKCLHPRVPFKNPLVFYRRAAWGHARQQVTSQKI